MKANPITAESLLEIGQEFYQRQWMWGTSGNLSARLQSDPLKIAITPGGLNKGHLEKQDLIEIEDGKPLPKHPRGRVPSSETAIHQAIYRAVPGAGAVFHVHALYSTLISYFHGNPKERCFLDVPWLEPMGTLGVGEEQAAQVAIVPNWSDVSLIARDITDYIQKSPRALPVVLVYNHGLTGWGTSPEQARNHLEAMEYVCKYLYLKRAAEK